MRYAKINQWLPSGAAIFSLLLAWLADSLLIRTGSPADFSYKDLAVLGLTAVLGAWAVARWNAHRLQAHPAGDYHKYIADALKEAALLTLILIAAIYLRRIASANRWFILLFFGLYSTLLPAVRWWQKKQVPEPGTQDLCFVLILGSQLLAQETLSMMARDPVTEYRVIGALDISSDQVGHSIQPGVEVIGILDDLEDILKRHVVDELIFTLPLRDVPDVEKHFELAEKVGVTVRIVPDCQIPPLDYKPRIGTMVSECIQGLQTITLVTPKKNLYSNIVKEILDYAGALALIGLLWPLMLLIIICIKLSDNGPAIFIQERMGWHGRLIRVFKFRTMLHDAERMQEELAARNEADGPVFKIKNDPRIIPVIGPVLRRSGLDELPQLFNVLKGQMSLVGPRPPIPGEVWRYETPQLRRLSVKPGITGLWQCTPNRNSLPFDRWVTLDLQYIDQWSLWLDLKILLKTVFIFFRFDGQ